MTEINIIIAEGIYYFIVIGILFCFAGLLINEFYS